MECSNVIWVIGYNKSESNFFRVYRLISRLINYLQKKEFNNGFYFIKKPKKFYYLQFFFMFCNFCYSRLNLKS